MFNLDAELSKAKAKKMFTVIHQKIDDISNLSFWCGDIAPVEATLLSGESFIFNDNLINELCNTKPLRRLKRIGFLGAIDYIKKGTGRSPNQRRHNRFEHSLGVSKLAEVYANYQELQLQDRRLLMVAALLHDVGHGPLSHTLEPVFNEEFGISHHQMGRNILRGETKLGDEIGKILRTYSIDVEEIITLIEGRHAGPLNFLFNSQINLDTIEGILRCRAFIGRRTAFETAQALAKNLFSSCNLPTHSFDAFWELKHSIYNNFITGNVGLALDAVAQAYMRDNISSFTADDFLITEKTLRKKHHYMFELFNMIVCRSKNVDSKIPKDLLNAELTFKKRTFYIEKHERLTGIGAINRRYRQSKDTISFQLKEILKYY